MAISFLTLDVKFSLAGKSQVRQWLQELIDREKKKLGEINYLFASDAYVLSQNQVFLKHDTYTDIITFHNNQGVVLNGDILISIDRVKENADTLNTDFPEELRRVMVHGVLHLCGYKDKSKEQKAIMRRKEEEALKLFKKRFC